MPVDQAVTGCPCFVDIRPVFGNSSARGTTTTRLGKTKPDPSLAPSPIRVHDFVPTLNKRPASQRGLVRLPARPQCVCLCVCVCVPLPTRARKTKCPHRDPGHFVPAVIKLNCYRSCGTSALAQPASLLCPGTFPLSVLTCHNMFT